MENLEFLYHRLKYLTAQNHNNNNKKLQKNTDSEELRPMTNLYLYLHPDSSSLNFGSLEFTLRPMMIPLV